MQAKDLPIAPILSSVWNRTLGIGQNISYIAALFPSVPEKVVRAKLRQLMRRGYIDGCLCGCRGDITIVGEPEAMSYRCDGPVDFSVFSRLRR